MRRLFFVGCNSSDTKPQNFPDLTNPCNQDLERAIIEYYQSLSSEFPDSVVMNEDAFTVEHEDFKMSFPGSRRTIYYDFDRKELSLSFNEYSDRERQLGGREIYFWNIANGDPDACLILYEKEISRQIPFIGLRGLFIDPSN